MLFVCGCLNVKIRSDAEVKPCDIKTTDLPDELKKDSFISDGLLQVIPKSDGVTIEQPYLVHKQLFDDWSSYQCLGCGLCTHAIKGMDSHYMLLVKSSLERDPAAISRLAQSQDYSKLYKIILKNQDVDLTQQLPDPSSYQYDALHSQLHFIQQQMNRFLCQEQESMESRIRHYEEQQKLEFEAIQVKVKDDKRKFISLLLNSQEKSSSILKQQKPPSKSQPVKESVKKQQSSPSQKTPVKKQPLTRFRSLGHQPAQRSPDSEGLFSFDEQEPMDSPFYEDDGSLDEEADIDHHRSEMTEVDSNYSIYSSSVPISVPAWRNQSLTDDSEVDNDLTPKDPSMIAESMQALAQSISDDHRYIFGDRPRPRLNTGDFHA